MSLRRPTIDDRGTIRAVRIVVVWLSVAVGLAGVLTGLSFLIVWALQPDHARPWPDPPSDDVMIQAFQENRENFDGLLRLGEAMVGSASVYPNHGTPVFRSNAAEDEAKALMKRLQVTEIVRSGGYFELTRYSVGFFSGRAKGYLYSTLAPFPLVQQTGQENPATDGVRVYRQIEPNWYIWYIWES